MSVTKILALDPSKSTGYAVLEVKAIHSSRENKYFRLVEPYQDHANIPKDLVMDVGVDFCHHPEKIQNVTGTCTLSAIPIPIDQWTITHYGLLEIDTKSEQYGDWYIDLEKQVDALLDEHRPDIVAIEEYFFTGGGGKFGGRAMTAGANLNPSYRAVMQMCVRRREGLGYEMVNVSSWKKWVANRATPTAEQIAKWGKERANKFFIQQALYEIHNLRFPSYMVAPQSKRIVEFRSDITDAVAIGMYVAHQQGGAKTFECAVPWDDTSAWDGKKPPKIAKPFCYDDLPSSKTAAKKAAPSKTKKRDAESSSLEPGGDVVQKRTKTVG